MGAQCQQGNANASTASQVWPSRLGEGYTHGACQHFHFLRNLKIPAPPAHIPGLVNKSHSHIPQVLFKLLLLCCVSD